ncbi:uncharacterized protein LOC117584218 [Drosophila guanche]|uniref:Uncharacterized protein n=1 Tax=Drosophila guanche TaxID=7266 RepID=A0A3B0K705_DROGU|nr:uncharacterized protein LOC117584218 [Drosophila guanche]SPP81416.1 Hypothetical predicted protein [Drosophila guanche]
MSNEIKRVEGGEVSRGEFPSTVGEIRSAGDNRPWETFDEKTGAADEAPCCSSTLLGLGAPTPSRAEPALAAPEDNRTSQTKRLNPFAAEFVPGVTNHIIAEKIQEFSCYSPWSIIGSPQNISCGPRYDGIWRESSLQQQLPHQIQVQDQILTEPMQPTQIENVEVSRDKVKPLMAKRLHGDTQQKLEQEQGDDVEEVQEPPKAAKGIRRFIKIPAGLKRRCSIM